MTKSAAQSSSEWRARNLEKSREAVRSWRARNPDKVAESQRRQRQKQSVKSPEKLRARAWVRRHTKAGTLTRQPCEVCGRGADVHAHHDDYDKPLEVRWLCRTHHREVHANG